MLEVAAYLGIGRGRLWRPRRCASSLSGFFHRPSYWIHFIRRLAGFARYSVDALWLVPHFEKMLYDNAQLIRVYLARAIHEARNAIH